MLDEKRVLDLDIAALDAHADVVDRILGDDLLHVTVRSVCDPASLVEINRRLDREHGRFEVSPVHPPESPDHGVQQLGSMACPTGLQPRGPAWETYLRAAARFREDCANLCEGLPDLENAVGSTLKALSGGRRTGIPELEEAASYSPATIRIFPAGCGAPWHRDAYPDLPVHAQLREIADLSVQLSWYLILTAPEKGGSLAVCFNRADAEAPSVSTEALSRDEEEQLDLVRFAPRPGDLVLFAGSRYPHCVEPSHGPRARRTFGGFAAPALDGETLYFWG